MAIPFFHAFRSTNRGRGPKYTVPCPKGRPRRTRRQGEDAERRRAQKDISGPAVHADGGTGGRHSPLLSDGGMVGQRRPRDVYKMRLQIGVHNGAFCCSGTLMKRRKFNGGKRCRLAFHAVDRGSNPLGDANEIMPLREIVRAFFVLGQQTGRNLFLGYRQKLLPKKQHCTVQHHVARHPLPLPPRHLRQPSNGHPCLPRRVVHGPAAGGLLP